MCHLTAIVRVLPSCHQLDRGPLDVSVGLPLSKIKSKAKCLAVHRPAFLLSLILYRQTDAKPQTHCGRCPQGVRRRALPLRRYTAAGHPSCRSYALRMSCTSSQLSAFSLRGLLGFVDRPLTTWSPRVTLLDCPLLVTRLDKSLSWLLNPYCVIALATSSVA